MTFPQSLLEKLPTRPRRLARRLVYWPLDALDRLRGADPLAPPRGLTDVGEGDFRATGERLLGQFISLGGLAPTDRVLDVGCGIGRMAIPLTGYLTPPGSYDGFDVRAADVRWCTKHITSRYPHFRFQPVPVASGEYRPGAGVDPAVFRFPFADRSFDFALATSLFTHLLPPALVNYLREIARVLAPGGRLFATFFLLNPEAERAAAAGGTALSFAPFGDAFVHDPRRPEGAVAYREELLLDAFAAAGLRPEKPIYGTWSGRRDGLDYQDIVIAER